MIGTDIFVQGGLIVLSLLPIALSQAKTEKIRRWDCIAGLFSQPFWFSYGWYTGAWSLCFLGVIYTGIFAYGFYSKWVRSPKSAVIDDLENNKTAV